MERSKVNHEVSRAKEGIYICGLIAGTGRIEARYLMALGCLAEDRGSDSAGVAWQVAEKLRVAKVAKNPLVAYPVDLAPAIRHAAKYKGPLIGHTRQATQGAVTARNAHPFFDHESHIAWAHNGIIVNDNDFGKFEVDSECLIGGIQKRDFSPYHGPIGLVWIEEGKLHAFRKGNPLHRGIKRGAVYLASEEGMLSAIGCHRIKELAEGFIYVWKGNVLESTRAVPYHKWERTDLTNWSHAVEYCEEYNYQINGRWHTHPSTTTWATGCAGCLERPAIGTNFPAKPETEDKTILPVRHAGSLAESYVERVEAERGAEAEIIDEEKEAMAICLACGINPRRTNSVWCEECLDLEPWRNH